MGDVRPCSGFIRAAVTCVPITHLTPTPPPPIPPSHSVTPPPPPIKQKKTLIKMRLLGVRVDDRLCNSWNAITGHIYSGGDRFHCWFLGVLCHHVAFVAGFLSLSSPPISGPHWPCVKWVGVVRPNVNLTCYLRLPPLGAHLLGVTLNDGKE